MADNGISNSYKLLQKNTELFNKTTEKIALESLKDFDSDSLFSTNNDDTSTYTSQATLRDIISGGDEILPDLSEQPWDEEPDDHFKKEPDPNMPDNACDL